MIDLPDAPWIRNAEMYGVPEPEKVYRCPICGEEFPERFLFVYGELVGCDLCAEWRDAEEYAADHPEETA